MPKLKSGLTAVSGADWHSYVKELPRANMRGIGTVKLVTGLEGALILDIAQGKYLLIDATGDEFPLDYSAVRHALFGVGRIKPG